MMHDHNMITKWFKNNPVITQIIAGIFDYNGVLRGKRVPVAKLDALLSSGLKMPLSIQILDIFGEDISGSEMVFASGDKDGTCITTGRLPIRLPHLVEPTALLVMYFQSDDKDAAGLVSPHDMLVRRAAHLDSTMAQLRCGVEMEFTLLAPQEAMPAASLATGEITQGGQILSALHLDDYDTLFAEISSFCASQSIEIETITSEAAIGQFEVTFAPKSQVTTLAEDILVFKYMIKALAKSHGLKASFMAKPLEGQPGNGMHVHVSALDEQTETNLFDETIHGPKGEANLGFAIGGLLSSMKEASLIVAPMMNSYRRLVASSHAPINICWGHDNRTAAIRVPASSAAARRLELRVAGADANPYLLLAWMVHAISQGLTDEISPPNPVVGNAYEHAYDRLADGMGTALAFAQQSEALAEAVGDGLWALYLATKRQEYERFSAHIPPLEFKTLSEQL